MRVILAGSDAEELARAAYPAFAAAGLEVAAVVGSVEELADVAPAFPDGVAVVQVEVYPSPQEAVEGLGSLPCRVAVVLPRWWEGERGRFAALPNLLAGFTGPVSWPQVAAEVKARGQGGGPEGRGGGGGGPSPGGGGGEPDGRRLRANTPAPRPGPRLHANGGGPARLVAFWSGPAGGTGRTALALALAAYAAERGVDVALLALSEPAVSAYLGLARVPNVTTFFETGRLPAAEQRVSWTGEDGRPVGFSVLLGPARPRDGAVERGQIGELVEAVGAAYGLVVMDLPSLPPGGNVWAMEPLLHAGNVILVAVPTSAGVAAVVEGLATLRDIGAAGRVHLALNRRSGGGLSSRSFVEGVRGLWGDCPPVAAEVPCVPDLAAAMDRRELPDLPELVEAVEALAEAAAGIQRAGPEGKAPTEGEGKPEGVSRPRRRRLGRLITVEVVD